VRPTRAARCRLPDLNGVRACRRLRQSWIGPTSCSPGVVMTPTRWLGWTPAPTISSSSRLLTSELLARIRAALRRAQPAGACRASVGEITIGGIRLDPDARKVWVDGQPVALSAREYDLPVAARRAVPAGCEAPKTILDRIVGGADFVGDPGCARTSTSGAAKDRSSRTRISPCTFGRSAASATGLRQNHGMRVAIRTRLSVNLRRASRC